MSISSQYHFVTFQPISSAHFWSPWPKIVNNICARKSVRSETSIRIFYMLCALQTHVNSGQFYSRLHSINTNKFKCCTIMASGSSEVKFPCSSCDNEVRSRHQALLCDQVEQWRHRKCETNLSQSLYRKISKIKKIINLIGFALTVSQRTWTNW